MNKKIIIAASLSIFLSSLILIAFVPVYAQDTLRGSSPGSNTGLKGGTVPAQTNQPTFTLQNPLKVNSIGELVQTFVEIFSYIVILIAVVMFIVTGFRYILYAAQGNSSEISKLHRQLLWLVIGVGVVIGARVIIQIVINTIEATGTVSQGVIDNARNANQGH